MERIPFEFGRRLVIEGIKGAKCYYGDSIGDYLRGRVSAKPGKKGILVKIEGNFQLHFKFAFDKGITAESIYEGFKDGVSPDLYFDEFFEMTTQRSEGVMLESEPYLRNTALYYQVINSLPDLYRSNVLERIIEHPHIFVDISDPVLQYVHWCESHKSSHDVLYSWKEGKKPGGGRKNDKKKKPWLPEFPVPLKPALTS